MSKEDKYQFKFGEESERPVVVKTGEGKANIAKWFDVSNKSKIIEGNITNFCYSGSNATLPTSIFNKNFTKLEETESTKD